MPPAGTEVVFNIAPGQNAFFVELAEALVLELEGLGVRSSIERGTYPGPRPGRVFVLIPPHEYAALTRWRPPRSILSRCIGLSAEQPGGQHFPANIDIGHDLGAVFDINPRAVRAYGRHGVAAQHLRLGYSPLWDRYAADDRDIDILFMGRQTARRERALARFADLFARYRCHLQLADGSRPGLAGAADFLAGDEKRALMSRAKVLLTIHGEQEPYFEWLRVAEAVCAGCAVVSEHSTDTAPLRPGEHLLTGGVDRVGLLAATLVDDAGMRGTLRDNAYRLLRDTMPMAQAARQLADTAARIDQTVPCVLRPTDRLDFINAKQSPQMSFTYQPPLSPHSEAEGRLLRALKSQKIDSMGLQRRLARLERQLAGDDSDQQPTRVVYESPAWSDAGRRAVSVIVPLYNHREHVLEAVDSVAGSLTGEWELIVVNDASTDDGGQLVEQWMKDRPQFACRLVAHAVNRGLPHARNTGAAHAEAELLLMLDADNQLRTRAIGKLRAALESDPGAAFAYGIVERFDVTGPIGLVSQFPWEPARLRSGNYIDALAMIRRAELEAMGGYDDDPRLHGWEDYDLWVRMAESGRRGAFVPEVIARYRVGHGSMISTSNVSLTDSFAALAEHAPELMRDLVIPH